MVLPLDLFFLIFQIPYVIIHRSLKSILHLDSKGIIIPLHLRSQDIGHLELEAAYKGIHRGIHVTERHKRISTRSKHLVQIYAFFPGNRLILSKHSLSQVPDSQEGTEIDVLARGSLDVLDISECAKICSQSCRSVGRNTVSCCIRSFLWELRKSVCQVPRIVDSLTQVF